MSKGNHQNKVLWLPGRCYVVANVFWVFSLSVTVFWMVVRALLSGC